MTVQLAKVIVNSIESQKTVIALENCLKSWDDCIDNDTITQGIFDRYSAIGQPLKGLRVLRDSLKVIRITGLNNNGDEVDIMYFSLNSTKFFYKDTLEFNFNDKILLCLPTNKDFFHDEEIETIGRYLMSSFYH